MIFRVVFFTVIKLCMARLFPLWIMSPKITQFFKSDSPNKRDKIIRSKSKAQEFSVFTIKTASFNVFCNY